MVRSHPIPVPVPVAMLSCLLKDHAVLECPRYSLYLCDRYSVRLWGTTANERALVCLLKATKNMGSAKSRPTGPLSTIYCDRFWDGVDRPHQTSIRLGNLANCYHKLVTKHTAIFWTPQPANRVPCKNVHVYTVYSLPPNKRLCGVSPKCGRFCA